jgi:transcription elongation factor Elf1
MAIAKKRTTKKAISKPKPPAKPTILCPFCNTKAKITKTKIRPDRKKHYILCPKCKKDSIIHKGL